MFARKLLSLHTAQLPVRTPLVAKSRVSATSKLIETKGLQVGIIYLTQGFFPDTLWSWLITSISASLSQRASSGA